MVATRITERILRSIILAVGVCPYGGLTSAQQVRVVEYPVFSTVEPGVQCGLYALLAAAQALERQIPIEDIVDGRWFTSMHGQTAADIARAGRHFGLQAVPENQLTVHSLYQANSPLILLLDDLRGRNESNHWVTFLGFQDDRVLIYDSHQGIRAISLAELMSRWGGAGVVISDSDQGRLVLRWWQWVNSLGLFLPALCFLFVVGGLFRPGPSSVPARVLWSRVFILIACVLGWLLMDTLTAPVSLLTNQSLCDAIRCHNARIDAAIHDEKLIAVNEMGGYAVVDARPPLACAAGHLPDAINIPVHLNSFQIKEAMSNVPFDSRIVVYCQNARCGWASHLAARLQCLGYQTYVLRDGIEGWSVEGRTLSRPHPVERP